MAASGRWLITPHALLRYQQRIRKGCTERQALGDLVRFSEEAHPVKEIKDGLWLYRMGRPERLRFRVQHVADGMPRLVTVLPEHDGGKR